jgi:hypothetical protein
MSQNPQDVYKDLQIHDDVYNQDLQNHLLEKEGEWEVVVLLVMMMAVTQL